MQAYTSPDLAIYIPSNVHIFWNKSLLISSAFNAVESIPTVFSSVKTSPPWKTKLLCVLKKGVKRIARQGFRHQLRLGEVPGYPMEHLPVVISEVGQCVCVWVLYLRVKCPYNNAGGMCDVCDDLCFPTQNIAGRTKEECMAFVIHNIQLYVSTYTACVYCIGAGVCSVQWSEPWGLAAGGDWWHP